MTPQSRIFSSVSRMFSSKYPDRVLALAPSILSADFANLEGDLRKMMRKKVYWTHVDVMDGHFVPNISIGVPVVKSLRKVSSRLFLDTHLMIDEPLRYAEAFADAGSDMITFHVETVDNAKKAVKKLRDLGVRPGVVIKPKTPVSAIEKILDQIDMVLVMTVEPGFGGQSMIGGCLNKVRELTHLRRERKLGFLVQVDGGISEKTAHLATAAGANILVAGSAVFGNGRVADNIEKLNTAATQA